MEETKGWDKFRVVPVKDMTGSLANKDWVLMWSKAFKVIQSLRGRWRHGTA